ncbi:MAG: aldo/keto reductase, partial [Chloroflexota bacterium]|nr:aldo/keto reductase [Chloroflexota bacterium]
LDQPQVAGVILGVRLGQSSHINDNTNTFDLNLNTEDRRRIEFVLGQSEDLYARVGDCGDEYRNRF